MKNIRDYQALKALKCRGRKRRLSARNGLKKTNGRFCLDAQSYDAYLKTLDLLNGLMNMDVAVSVVIRRALRLYASHVMEIAKASKGIDGKRRLYKFLNSLEAERAALMEAACHDTDRD